MVRKILRPTVSTNGLAHGPQDSLEQSETKLPYAPLTEAAFARWLRRERRRTERSSVPFVLMTLDVRGLGRNGSRSHAIRRIVPALAAGIREVDVLGWCESECVLGILFTEFGKADPRSAPALLTARITELLSRRLSETELARVEICCHTYPEDSEPGPGRRVNTTLYRDVAGAGPGKRLSDISKRLVDILGSAAAIVILSPLLLAIAAAIKLSSRGPVLFRQVRVGRYGQRFTFLKFRSMHVENDPSVHREYVLNFIRGQAEAHAADDNERVFKITSDPRVTPVGRLLRRTSLDELPQFFNVLMGHMSLVGPRPPLEYESEAYDLWHLRRLFEVKPGITGLWQVSGRSKTSFDEMVRLDLQYASRRSLLLDLKILLLTPKAVLSGEGAY